MTGDGWIEFDRRLGPEWIDLATFLGIPIHVQDRFPPGREPREIRAWLERADNLAALPDALSSVGRNDLVDIVTNAITKSRESGAERKSGDLPLPDLSVARLASELVASSLGELRISTGRDPALLKERLRQETRAQDERLQSLMSIDVSSDDLFGGVWELMPRYRTSATQRLASPDASLCLAVRNAWLGEEARQAMRIAARARSEGDFPLALKELRDVALRVRAKRNLPLVLRSGRSSTQFYYSVERDPEDEDIFAQSMALRGAVALDLLRKMSSRKLDRRAQEIIHDALIGQLYPAACQAEQGRLNYGEFVDEAAWAMDNILHAAGLYRADVDSPDRKAVIVRLTRSMVDGIRKSGLFELWRMFTTMDPTSQARTEDQICSSTLSYVNSLNVSDSLDALLARVGDRELVFQVVYSEVFRSIYDFGTWRHYYLP